MCLFSWRKYFCLWNWIWHEGSAKNKKFWLWNLHSFQCTCLCFVNLKSSSVHGYSYCCKLVKKEIHFQVLYRNLHLSCGNINTSWRSVSVKWTPVDIRRQCWVIISAEWCEIIFFNFVVLCIILGISIAEWRID